jgi:P pilus assembly chaperone PapD
MRTLALVGLVAVGCADTSLYVHEEYLTHVHTQVVYPRDQSEAMLEIQNTGARPIALRAPLYLFSDRATDKSCPSPELAITENMSIGPRATVQVPIIGEDAGKFVGVCFWVRGSGDVSVYPRAVWSENRLR